MEEGGEIAETEQQLRDLVQCYEVLVSVIYYYS